MKKYILLILAISATINAFSQSRAKQKFIDAEFDFLYEEYDKALNRYLYVYNKESDNANVCYRLGLCYSFLNEYPQAIPFLEKATQNITTDYREGSFKEKFAPIESYLYLGHAYRKSGQMDKAIKAFNAYRNEVTVDNFQGVELANHEIRKCENAVRFMKTPLSIEVQNLGSNFNNELDNYYIAVSADQSVITYASFKNKSIIFAAYKEDDGNWSVPKNINGQLKSSGYFYPVWLSEDGSKMILFAGDSESGDLYMAKREDRKWLELEPFAEEITSKYRETSAALTKDGLILCFSADIPGGYGGLDLYASILNSDGKWGEPFNLGPTINSKYDECSPYVMDDGTTMYFASQGHENIGGYDIFVTKRSPKGWSKPLNIGYPINTPRDELYFTPVDSGSVFYMSRFDEKGQGKLDNYKITIGNPVVPLPLQEDTILVNKDSIPSDTIDIEDMVLSANTVDSTQLALLTEDVNTQTDNYSTQQNVENDTTANNNIEKTILTENNTEDSSLVNDNETVLTENKTVDSNQNNDNETVITENTTADSSQSEDNETLLTENNAEDTNQNNEPNDPSTNNTETDTQETTTTVSNTQEEPVAKEFHAISINGTIKLADNNEVSGIQVNVKDPKTGKNLAKLEADENGKYTFTTIPGNYMILISAKNYENAEENIVIPENYSLPDLNITTNLNPTSVKNETYYVVNNIFFNNGISTLDRDAKIELEKLYRLMDENPNLKVEITGYTDASGSPEVNQRLSEKRANSTFNYLVEKGISRDRIIKKGLGETNFITVNSTEEGRKYNRRVELKVLNTDGINITEKSLEIPDYLKSGKSETGSASVILLANQADKIDESLYTDKKSLKNITIRNTDKGYLYTLEDIKETDEALKTLNKLTDIFPDARIISTKELGKLTGSYDVKGRIGKNVYTIQVKASTKPMNMDNMAFSNQITEYKGSDNFYRYTYKEFLGYSKAKSEMDKIKDAGYNDAFIISLENIISKSQKQGFIAKMTNDNPSNIQSGMYSVQVKATLKPVNMSIFKNLDNVNMHFGKDGFYRYSCGKYNDLNEAKKALKTIREKGYTDAFIVSTDRYKNL